MSPMAPVDAQKTASSRKASENWDDDFDFLPAARHVSAPLDHPIPHSPKLPPVPSQTDFQSFSSTSASDWSADADLDDYSPDSPTPAPSHPSPPPLRPRSPPTRSSTATFFARISPVRRWKARDKSSTLYPTHDATRTRPPALPAEPAFVVHPPPATPPPTRLSPTPLTPDLTFSVSSLPSPSDSPSIRRSSSLFPLPPKSSRPSKHTLIPSTNIPPVPSTVDNHPSLLLPPRRSSLGDLRPTPAQLNIPDRIYRVQNDIKRDMTDVKEFATCIEQLRNLQHVYVILIRDIRATLSPPSSPSKISARRSTSASLSSPNLSPTKFPHPIRKIAFAMPLLPFHPLPDPLTKLEKRYALWWELADLLVALGGRDEAPEQAFPGRRQRAATLETAPDVFAQILSGAGDGGPSPPSPPSPQLHATTGRTGGSRVFTPRQLVLLHGMLTSDATTAHDRASPKTNNIKTRVSGGGKFSIRDMWRGLRKAGIGGLVGPPSSGSSGCDSSASEGCHHQYPAVGTSSSSSAAATVVPARRKQPTRRPSIAGIFGLVGQPRAPLAKTNDDSFSGGDTPPPNEAVRRHTLSRRPASSPRDGPSPPPLSSSGQEFPIALSTTDLSSPPKARPGAAKSLLSKAAGTPPASFTCHLALTPDNIRPLLGHARVVNAQLTECITEARSMLNQRPAGSVF